MCLTHSGHVAKVLVEKEKKVRKLRTSTPHLNSTNKHKLNRKTWVPTLENYM